ncbi:hypothetical protein, partial [Gemmiger formicilis]|uniref:hypothetical protein n=1 Tax=Gemmiger formicilis TaxID=745368 RepID=UPI00242CEB03
RSSLLVYNLYLLLCRKEQAAYILNEQFCFAKHIAKLREKLDLGPDDLKTVMGRGYTLSMQKSCGTSRSLGESLYSDR